MSKIKISGIYKITAKHNGKIYIGQSNDIYNRWKSHWKQVARGDKDHIHNSMRKYGKENFQYEIIEICEQDIINDREIYWIKYYDSYNNGYNLTTGGEGVKGKKYSINEKEKMREYAKDNNLSKPILQFDTNGNIINEWRSCSEIGSLTNMLSTNIHDCIKHKDGYRLAYGYIWLYKDEYLKNGLDITPYLSNNRNITYFKIYQISDRNEIIKIWDNIKDIVSCNKKYKLHTIYAACYGHIKTAYNYVWLYEKDYKKNFDYSVNFVRNSTCKKIYQFKTNGDFVNSYDSINEAETITEIGKTAISQCARHELKTAGNFIWLFEDEKDRINSFSNPIREQQRRIEQIDNYENVINTFNSITEAANLLKLDQSCISKVCNGKLKHTKGYIFRYIS